MRYDDTSNAGSMAADSAPTARPDTDSLPSNDMGPASGNVITGAGTASGAAGADTPGDGPARVVELNGAGGPTAASGDSFQAAGQYGVLTMDAQGNFNYVRNAGTPDGVQDVFGYTIADRDGSTSATTLTMNVGEAITLQAQNVINLPAGVQMSDIKVVGRDLVINMPDGTQMVIPNGAVFVPQLVIGDTELPASNLASVLIDAEPEPAAGQQFSSGGPPPPPVPPLDPGVPLGDLIPPTEMNFPPLEFPEVGQFEDNEPSLVIDPDDNEPAVNAFTVVDESGLPARGAEPAGTLEAQNIETRGGQILIDSGDGIASLVITVNGVSTPITEASVGDVITGLRGNLTITSVNLDTGVIGYSYTVTDNTIDGGPNPTDFEDFIVTVTDNDGDTATGTLHVDILDDEPIARDDTDSLAQGETSTDGNVLTAVNTTNSGADTPGADGFSGETNNAIDGVTGIHPGASGSFTTVPQDGTGVTVNGTFGQLTIHVDGSYTYTLFEEGNEQGGQDVFTYQITDGDGDNDTATLTITVPADIPPQGGDTLTLEVDDDALPIGNNSASDDEVDSGTLSFTAGTDPLVDFAFSTDLSNLDSTVLTWEYVSATEIRGWDGGIGSGDLIITLTLNAPASIPGGTSGDVTITATLSDNFDSHPGIDVDDLVDLGSVQVIASEADPADFATGTVNVGVSDDVPVIIGQGVSTTHVDEDELPNGISDGDGDDTTDSGVLLGTVVSIGADQPGHFGWNASEAALGSLPALTSGGVDVLYTVDGDTLVAYLDGGDPTDPADQVFTVEFTDTATGAYTVTLLAQIDHLPNNPPNSDDQTLTIDLSAVASVEDADHDSVDLPAGSFTIVIEDDVPVQDDEGNAVANVDEDELPGGITDGDGETLVATGSISGQAQFGADRPGSFSWDSNPLVLNALPALTSGGVNVLYTVSGTTLIAYLQGGDSSDPADQVFTVNLTAGGDYTVTLKAPIDHPLDAPANDNQDLAIDLSGAVLATDFDTDSVHLDAGSFVVRIEDDIPVAVDDTDTVVEGASTGGNVLTGVGGDLNPAGADLPGADGFETPNTVVGVVHSSNDSVDTNDPTTVNVGIAGTYGTLTLHSDGSYTYLATPGANPPPGAQDIFTYTIIDGDGDLDSATLTINVINDFQPQIGTPQNIVVDEDGLAAGNDDSSPLQTDPAETDANEDASVSGQVVVNFGEDVPPNLLASIVLLDNAAYDGQLKDLAGNNVTFALNGPHQLIGTANGVQVMTITITNAVAGPGAGDVTYTYEVQLLQPIQHDDVGNNENSDFLNGVQFTVTDEDGDPATGSFNVQVVDDVPKNNGTELTAPTVHEDALNNADAVGNPEGGGQTVTASISVASLLSLVSIGADQPGTIGINPAIDGVNTGLTQNGVNIVWNVVSATEVQGLVGNNPADVAFTIVRSGSNYTFTLLDNIDNHPSGAGDSDLDNLSLANVFTATDADGDTIVIDAGASVNIQNDVPINNGASYNAGTVHEDALANPNATGNPEGGGQVTSIQILGASLASLVSPGADSPVTISLNAIVSGQPGSIEGVATGETLLGTSIVWHVVGPNEIQGVLSGDTSHVVFTITDNPGDANFTFTLLDNIDNNPSGAGDADTDPLNLAGVFTATDTDGDKVIIDAGATVNIQNDVPINNNATYNVGEVQEDALNNSNSVGNSEGGQSTTIQILGASLLGLVTAGADSPVTLSLNNLPLGQTGTIEGTATGLTQYGDSITWHVVSATQINGVVNGNVVFTITDNPGDSNFTFTLVDNIDHDSDADLLTGHGDSFVETLSLAGVFTATDTDGDKVIIDGGASIDIENDVPTLGTIDDGTASNDPTDAHSFGDLNFSIGADEPATVESITLSTGATSGGRPIVTQFNSATGVLTAYQDVGPAGYDAGDTTVVFTLTVDPDAGASGQWEFDLVTPLDPTVIPVAIGDSSSFGAGPALGQILDDGADVDPVALSVVSGYLTGGTFDFATWFGNGSTTGGALSAANIDPEGVNGSTVGWGIPNNSFNGGNELMFFDLGDEALSDPDGGEAFAPPGGTSLPQVSFAEFDFFGYNGGAGNLGDDIAYVVQLVDADGNPAGTLHGFVPEFALDGSSHDPSTNFTITAPAGTFIANVQFYSGANPDGSVQDLGQGKIALVSVGVESSSIDKDLDFTVKLSDSDGDDVTGSFTINVSDGNSPSTLSLLSANDNLEQQKLASLGSNTMIMAGALAAAGLESQPLAAETKDDGNTSDSNEDTSSQPQVSTLVADTSSDDQSSSVDQLVGIQVEDSDKPANKSSHSHDDAAGGDKGANHQDAPVAAVSELSQGTDAPSQGEAHSSAPAMAASVGVPSAAALVAAAKDGVDAKLESVDGKHAEHSEHVAKVLADALQGGDNAKDLDALINAVAGKGHGHGEAANDALASHGGHDVSNGDMAGFGGLSAGHGMDMMTQMTMHQDAAPAQA